MRITAAVSARCIWASPTSRSRPTTRSSGSATTASARWPTTSFPPDSLIRRLYEWEELTRFVARDLELDAIYPYADPLGALNLAVMGDGEELQWHFDQTDFVVSLALQDADEGGDFEVAPQIRTADDERYDDVARVLDGDRAPIVTLPMTPGTLLVFAGRNSLHRVSADPRLDAPSRRAARL